MLFYYAKQTLSSDVKSALFRERFLLYCSFSTVPMKTGALPFSQSMSR